MNGRPRPARSITCSRFLGTQSQALRQSVSATYMVSSLNQISAEVAANEACSSSDEHTVVFNARFGFVDGSGGLFATDATVQVSSRLPCSGRNPLFPRQSLVTAATAYPAAGTLSGVFRAIC